MLKKMLNNKKIVITSITIVILVLVILLVKCGQDKPTGTESEFDTGVKQEETYVGDGLEVEEDDQKTENSADTSEYWEDTEDGGNKTESTVGNKTEGSKEDNKGGSEGDNPGGSEENETEEPEYENNVTEEDIPEDEESWGGLY